MVVSIIDKINKSKCEYPYSWLVIIAFASFCYVYVPCKILNAKINFTHVYLNMLPTFKLSQYKLMIPRLLFNWNSRKHVFVKLSRMWRVTENHKHTDVNVVWFYIWRSTFRISSTCILEYNMYLCRTILTQYVWNISTGRSNWIFQQQ